ncbi:MAG TPA: transposase [Ktedonobacterales bacterium]|nr:transposase [Ktedonobacterales bacterium]
MKASFSLWRQWSAQVRQFLPDVHGHRTKSLAFFVFGLVLSGKARLPLVAEALLRISPAKTPSIERRLQRFLSNEQIAVVPIWTSLLAYLLPFFRDKRLTFVLDPTPLSDRACVVYLGLLVHSRLLPVGWQVMPLQETWEEGQWAIVGILLDRVTPHVGQAECLLIADSGLAGMSLVQLCQARGWHYLLRLSKTHTCCPACGKRADRWWAMSDLVTRVGQPWFGPALVWQEHRLDAFLSAVWEPGYHDAWFLLSDQPAGRARLQAYRRRMRVEASFCDFKRRGWDIEGTVVADRARLERLLLVLFLGVWWVSHLAAACMHDGHRERFDRHDRRDKGIFRIGRLWLHDLLRRELPAASFARCLPFHRTGTALAFALRF